MQKTTVIGRVGQDAIVRQAGNTQVISFSVCHSESYKNKEGVKVEKSQWFNCSYFTDKTNVANYIKKGDNIYVEGNVDIETYENKSKLVLKVTSIQLLGSKQEAKPTTNDSNTADDTNEPFEQLPF